MLVKLTLRDLAGNDHDVAVNAPPATTLGDVAGQLSQLCPDAARGFWHGPRRLGLDSPLGRGSLGSGQVIGAGGPQADDGDGSALLRLHVAGGPGAGEIFALPRGDLVIGRAPDCPIPIRDPRISRQHALLSVRGTQVSVRDLESTNGTSCGSARRPSTSPCPTNPRPTFASTVQASRWSIGLTARRCAGCGIRAIRAVRRPTPSAAARSVNRCSWCRS